MAKQEAEYQSNFISSHKRLLVIAGVIVLAAFAGYRLWPKKAQTTYQTATVEKGTLIQTVTASGQIINSNYLPITTQASGTVKTVYVKDGEKVVAGQKIAEVTLDTAGQQKNTQAWSSYQSAKNSYANAQAQLNTLQVTLFSTNQKLINDAVARDLEVTDPTYIQENAAWLAAEMSYKTQSNVIAQTQSNVSSAWAAYQLTSPIIAAPGNGMVSNVVVVPGMNINTSYGSSSVSSTSSSNQNVAVILNGGTPLATVNISEVDVAKVNPGQKVTLTVDSLPGKTFSGKVATIDRIGVVSSGVTNYPSIIKFDTAANEILPNMSITASIITNQKDDVLNVPSEAVRSSNGSFSVRLMSKGQPVETPVEVGLTSDTQTEIVSGVKEGDIVVTSVINQASGNTTTGTSVFGGGLRTGSFGGSSIGGGGALRPGGR